MRVEQKQFEGYKFRHMFEYWIKEDCKTLEIYTDSTNKMEITSKIHRALVQKFGEDYTELKILYTVSKEKDDSVMEWIDEFLN